LHGKAAKLNAVAFYLVVYADTVLADAFVFRYFLRRAQKNKLVGNIPKLAVS
jgi:hypothetical protein